MPSFIPIGNITGIDDPNIDKLKALLSTADTVIGMGDHVEGLMTSAELSKYIDQHGILNTEGGKLGMCIHTLDARESYGRLDVLVEPMSGTGQTWVSESRIAWEVKL